MRCYLLAALLVICSCASSGESRKIVTKDKDGNLVTKTVSDTFDGAQKSVKSPFKDLGLMEEDIPDMLEEVADNPYEKPEKAKCQNIMEEMAELDEILGQDKYIQTNLVEEEESYAAKGAKLASNVAVGALASKLNIIPFRGIVRKITGAEAHEKEVSRAYQAGQLRRAYLRGMADSKGMKCKPKVIEVKAKEPPEKKYNYAVNL